MIMESKQAKHYILLFFIIMFKLCYWYDRRTGIVFTGSYNFI